MSSRIVTLNKLEDMGRQSGLNNNEVLNDFNNTYGNTILGNQCPTKGEIITALGSKINPINDWDDDRLVKESLIIFNAYQTYPVTIKLTKGGDRPLYAGALTITFYQDDGSENGEWISYYPIPTETIKSGTLTRTYQCPIKLPNSVVNNVDYPLFFSLKYGGTYYTQLTSNGSIINYEHGINDDADEAMFTDTDKDGFITSFDSPTIVGRNRITWPLKEISIYAETYGHKSEPGGGDTPNLHRINITLNVYNGLTDYIGNSEIQLTVIYDDGTVAATFFAPSVPPNASVNGSMRTIYIDPSRREYATILAYSDDSYTLSIDSPTSGNGGEGEANDGVGLTNVYLEDGMVIDIGITRGV